MDGIRLVGRKSALTQTSIDTASDQNPAATKLLPSESSGANSRLHLQREADDGATHHIRNDSGRPALGTVKQHAAEDFVLDDFLAGFDDDTKSGTASDFESDDETIGTGSDSAAESLAGSGRRFARETDSESDDDLFAEPPANADSSANSSASVQESTSESVAELVARHADGEQAQSLLDSLTSMGANAGHVREAFAKPALRTDKAALLAYCSLRNAGLDEVLADKSLSVFNARSDLSHSIEAAASPPVARTLERTRLYCAYRALGQAPADAANLCRFGPCYLQLHASGNLEKCQQHLDRYKISRSPLSFPRIIATSLSSRELGRGQAAVVYEVTLRDEATGEKKSYAFKRMFDHPQISVQGLFSGIKPKQNFPELRHIMMVETARLLGLCGDGGVIGDACVAIIDGEPGLLMDLAKGEADCAFYGDRELRPDSAAWRLVNESRDTLLQDPEKYDQLCSQLGVHSIYFDGDAILVSGSEDHSQSKIGAAQRATSGSYRRAANLVQLVLYLSNASDHHGENMLLMERDGKHVLSLIDGVECMGARAMQDLLGELNDKMRKYAFHMVARPREADQECAGKALSSAFLDGVDLLVEDARPALPEDQLTAFRARASGLVSGLQDGSITQIDDEAGWLLNDPQDPASSLWARNNRRMDPSAFTRG